MKEFYTKPESEITEFAAADVLTTESSIYKEEDGNDPF